MKQLLVALALTLSLPAAAENEIKFSIHGKLVEAIPMAQVEKLVPPVELTVLEPHENKAVKYKGFAAGPLFDKVYGEGWREVEDALFTCSDGYQPTVAVERFLKYDGLFAFERVGSEFNVVNTLQGNEKVGLGPLYLVWDNIESPELKQAGAEGWPYQVVAVDFIDPEDRFPHMIPPKRASTKARRGFEGFRRHCFACHKVNGDGGDKSIDLNQPESVTRYWKSEWLKQWILDPSSIRPGTAMPALNIEGKAGERVADEILAYLRAMSTEQKP